MVESIVWPVSETPTGWAEPVLVPGAMTKMSQAMAMKNPAEADREPLGPTNAATGVLALTTASVLWRMEVSRPPRGVERQDDEVGALAVGLLQRLDDVLGSD